MGNNRLLLEVKDEAGRLNKKIFNIVRKEKIRGPLSLTVDFPSETNEKEKVRIKGTVSGGKGERRLTVGEKGIELGEDGSFSIILPLKKGKNSVTVHVEDSAGGIDSQTWLLFQL